MLHGELYTGKYLESELIVLREESRHSTGESCLKHFVCRWSRQAKAQEGLHTLTHFYPALATTFGCFPPG